MMALGPEKSTRGRVEDMGGRMETSGAGAGTGDPRTGGRPGVIGRRAGFRGAGAGDGSTATL